MRDITTLELSIFANDEEYPSTNVRYHYNAFPFDLAG